MSVLNMGPLSSSPFDCPEEPFVPDERDTVNAESLIRFVRQSWRLCLIWIVAALALGLLFLKLAPSYYTASTSILLDELTDRSADQGGAAAAADPAYVDSQVEVLQSDEVIGRVVDQIHLTEVEEFQQPNRPAALSVREWTIIWLRRVLSVRRIGTSNVVEIGLTSRDPARSAAIVTAIAKSYIDGQLERRRQARMQRSLTTGGDAVSAGARVIIAAHPPAHRSWPRTLIVLAAAFAIGIAGSIVHALIRQVTDRRLRSVDDVRQVAGLDCIVAIHRVAERSWEFDEPRHSGLQTVYGKRFPRLYDPISKLAVRQQLGRGHRNQTIVGIVAPTAGAGASSVAATLAKVIAGSGGKTLLVDANWRKPALAKPMLNAQAGRKLARALASIDLEPGKLDVLLLRATEPISDLNASLSIVAALQHQQAEYETIVVDFHSAGETADFEASIGAVNDLIVVAEARRTSSGSLRDLLRLIPNDKLVAVILNKT